MIGLTYIMQLDGITGKELAQRLGVTPSTISQWEKQVRPVAKDRLPQLSKIFPAYEEKYFQKELDKIDKLLLDNDKKNYQIRTLNWDDKIAQFNERKRLENEISKNEALIKQYQILDDISNLFANAYNIKSLNDVLEQNVMITHFSQLCEIEKKILTNYLQNQTDAVAFKEASGDIINDIKQFSLELEKGLSFIEKCILYSSK